MGQGVLTEELCEGRRLGKRKESHREENLRKPRTRVVFDGND